MTADGQDTPGPERCSSCGSAELTRLPMVLTDGTDVLFVSCQVCEGREWLTVSDGDWTSLPIETVLKRSTRQT
jgi:hypothetical protein